MPDLLRHSVLAALWFGLCAWGIGRGRTPERVMGLVHLVGAVLTPLVQYNLARNGAELGVFVVDTTALLLGLWVALRWDRWWAIFGAAFMVCQSLVHVVRLFNLGADQFWYASTAMFWSYAGLFAMAFGVGQIEWSRYRNLKPAAV